MLFLFLFNTISAYCNTFHEVFFSASFELPNSQRSIFRVWVDDLLDCDCVDLALQKEVSSVGLKLAHDHVLFKRLISFWHIVLLHILVYAFGIENTNFNSKCSYDTTKTFKSIGASCCFGRIMETQSPGACVLSNVYRGIYVQYYSLGTEVRAATIRIFVLVYFVGLRMVLYLFVLKQNTGYSRRHRELTAS